MCVFFCPQDSHAWSKMQVLQLGCLASVKYFKNIYVKRERSFIWITGLF